MTVFDRLVSSGIPITWTAVGFAYLHRFKEPWYASTLIITEQVLAFALDQIGYVPPELESLTAELAFAHPTDTWTIKRCLEELVSDAPEDVQYALQVWRWVLLNDIVTGLEEDARNIPSKSEPYYGAWSDDFRTAVLCDLGDIWESFEFPSEGFAVTEDWQNAGWVRDIPTTIRLIEEHRRWLDYELVLLRSHSTNRER